MFSWLKNREIILNVAGALQTREVCGGRFTKCVRVPSQCRKEYIFLEGYISAWSVRLVSKEPFFGGLFDVVVALRTMGSSHLLTICDHFLATIK